MENETQAGMKMSCIMVLLRASLVLFRTTNSEKVISQQWYDYFCSYQWWSLINLQCSVCNYSTICHTPIFSAESLWKTLISGKESTILKDYNYLSNKGLFWVCITEWLDEAIEAQMWLIFLIKIYFLKHAHISYQPIRMHI